MKMSFSRSPVGSFHISENWEHINKGGRVIYSAAGAGVSGGSLDAANPARPRTQEVDGGFSSLQEQRGTLWRREEEIKPCDRRGKLPKSSGFVFTHPSGEEPTESVWEAGASVSGGAAGANVSLRDLD